MNWYKKAQTETWPSVIQSIEERNRSLSLDNLPYKLKDIYRSFVDMGLEDSEIKESILAIYHVILRPRRPKYFIKEVRSNPQYFPNISAFKDEALIRIWNFIVGENMDDIINLGRFVKR